MKDGSYHEIDLKECHKWTREGCTSCPDFDAEHSDIATGATGKHNDWTLTIVRTELGEEVIKRMIADGSAPAVHRRVRPAPTAGRHTPDSPHCAYGSSGERLTDQGANLRTRLLSMSAMYTFPAASTATPRR
jgi:hypothetical protein